MLYIFAAIFFRLDNFDRINVVNDYSLKKISICISFECNPKYLDNVERVKKKKNYL